MAAHQPRRVHQPNKYAGSIQKGCINQIVQHLSPQEITTTYIAAKHEAAMLGAAKHGSVEHGVAELEAAEHKKATHEAAKQGIAKHTAAKTIQQYKACSNIKRSAA